MFDNTTDKKKKTSHLVLLKTHLLTDYVYEEYYKLTQTPDVDCIIYLDNETVHWFNGEHNPIEKRFVDAPARFGDQKFECTYLITDKKMLEETGLPLLSDKKTFNYKTTVWYNSDYPLYVTQQYFPNYDYYWSFEYDIYCNANNYSAFFIKYLNIESDLLVLNYNRTCPDWIFKEKTDWAYKDVETYYSIFPLIRMNNKAINALRQRRMERGKQYLSLEKHMPANRWLFCELFAPTEATLLGLSIQCMQEKYIRTEPLYNFFRLPHTKREGQLFHPVKSRVNEDPPKRKYCPNKIRDKECNDMNEF